VITLLSGVAVGYLVRGSGVTGAVTQTTSGSTMGSTFGGSDAGQPSRAELTARILGLLPQRSKTRPNDADLFINIGNAYYDAQEYANAIDNYQKGMKLRPDNVNVRSEGQYEVSRKFQPTHAQTLFNMGIVRWQR
jgi:tetratricopeptide (TPR) repeat protein